MEQKAEELYEDHKDAWCSSQTTISVDERVFMVLKHTETGNILETVRRFQRQFPNQRTPCRQTMMDKL